MSDPRRDADTEIRFHLESRAAELERTGLTPEAARRRAEREFGDVAAARARLAGSAATLARRSDRRRLRDEIRQDIRYGARQLRTHRGFAVIAALTLALGAGATAAIFSVVDAVLLRPLPWKDAGELVAIWESHPQRGDRGVVSRGNYLDWRDEATSFSELAAWMAPFGYAITGDGAAEYWTGAQVTPSLFTMLGVAPLVGRALVEGEDDAIVLGEALWRSRYGGDPSVLGRRVFVDGSPATIAGVMPADFGFPSSAVDFWLPTPLPPQYRQQREAHVFRVLGRLAPGQTAESADRAMDALAGRIAESWPNEMKDWSVNVVPLRADMTGGVRPILLVLLGAVALVLLMACANVANLLLARATAREHEVAVRSALGASRSRLVRQFLTESLLLAVAGGVLGIGIAWLLLRGLIVFGPADVPFLDDARLDARVLGFTTALVFLTTVLIGLVPALRAAGPGTQMALRSQGRVTDGVGHGRLRRGILSLEVAVSVVLVVAAGLLGRSLLRAQAVDPGMSLDGTTLAWLSLPQSDYATADAHVAFYDEVLARLAAVSGVDAVGGTSEPPVRGFDMTRTFEIEGRPDAFDNVRADHRHRLVSTGWFDAMGIGVVQGRLFSPSDRAEAPPVAIVNRSLARLFFADGAVGKRIRFGADAPWTEIVGVVNDVRQYGFEQPDQPAVYVPFAQKTWNWLTWMTVGVRGAVTPEAFAPALREIVRDIDANVPVQRVQTTRDLYVSSLARRRFQTVLVATFALLALVLGAIGIYGVASHSAAQRSNEIRLRLILGAQPRQVTRLIVGQEMRATLVGLAFGIVIAGALARLVANQLYGVAATDLPTFALTGSLLVAVAASAAWLATRRAASGPLRPR